MTPFVLALVLLSPVQKTDVSGQVKLANGRNAGMAAIWLDGSEKGKPLQNAVIDQHDRMFDPHVTVITVGTSVKFPNNDTVTHNVFVEFGKNNTMDLHGYPRGSSKTWTFANKGLVILQCNMHAEMGAFIVVVDTPYYAVTDDGGRFSIKGVPAGRYKLHGWHESGQTLEQDVTVTSGANLNFSLERKRK